MDVIRTMTREHRRCPEYSKKIPTRRVDETSQFGDRTQRDQPRSDGLDRICPERRTRV